MINCDVKKQISALDMVGHYRGAIMGIAAWMIILFHCWIPQIPYWPVLGNLEAAIKQYGYVGVDMFFFLSGMGMTYAMRKERILVFYKKRIRRTVFPYIAMALICWAFEQWSLKWLLMICTGYAFYRIYMYSFLWFVPAILTLYAVYPLYHNWIVRAKAGYMVVVNTILGVVLMQLLLQGVIREDFWGFINRIPVFCLGIFFAETGRETPFYMKGNHWLACGMVFITGCVLMVKGNAVEHTLLPSFNCALPAALIAVSLCFLTAGLLHFVENFRGFRIGGKWIVRILTFFGGFSLELYCVQEFLYGRIFDGLRVSVSHFMINWIAIAAIVAAGYGLFLLHGAFWRVADKLFCRKRK